MPRLLYRKNPSMDVITRDVIPMVMQEFSRSCEKHPHYTNDRVRQVGIVVEEAGEAMREAIDATRTRVDEYEIERLNAVPGAERRLFAELIQTAAMAIKAAAALQEDIYQGEVL